MTPHDVAPFQLSVENFPGGRVVRLVGELDLSSESLMLAVADTTGWPGESVVLDLTELSFIDSFGVKAIMTLRDSCPGLRYRYADGIVARVLHIAGLDHLQSDDVVTTASAR